MEKIGEGKCPQCGRKVRYISSAIWSIAGITLIVLLCLAINVLFDTKSVISEVGDFWLEEVSIEDIRSGISALNTGLEIKRMELELQLSRGDYPLDYTEENYQAYLDFCGRTGYVVSDYTWREYRWGRLIP